MPNVRPQEQSDQKLIQQPKASAFSLEGMIKNLVPGAVVAYTLFPGENAKKYKQIYGFYPFARAVPTDAKQAVTSKPIFVPYRGASIFAANVVPTTFIQLTTKNIIDSQLSSNPTEFQQFGRGLACGFAGSFPATFMELYVASMIKLNRQYELEQAAKPVSTVSPKKASTQEILAVMKKHPNGPLAGWSGVVSRDAIFTAAMLYSSPKAAEAARNKFGNDSLAVPVVRVAADFGAAAFSHVFDTTATAMQRVSKKTSFRETAKSLYQNEGGAPRFFRGLGSRFVLFFSFSNGIPYVENATQQAMDHVKKYFAK